MSSLTKAHQTAKARAKKANDERYIVWDGSPEGENYGGWQVATAEDLDTYFNGCRIEAAYLSDGSLEQEF